MFQGLLITLGFIFLVSLLLYIIPQILIVFLPPLDLKKRYGHSWALVTGGSSGIGRSFAFKLAVQGLNIIILGTNSERLSSTEIALRKINPSIEVRVINADLSDDAQETTKSILYQLKGLDISVVFFNAGYGVMESCSQPSPKSLNQFHTNIVTHQHLFNALYPRIAARQENAESKKRGAVLFTASCAGVIPSPFMTIYAATKAYLGQFGECLAVESAGVGIDVVSLHPGPTQTLFFSRIPGSEKSFGKMNALFQSPDRCAGLALSAIGRFVRVDSGLASALCRVFATKLVDVNVMLLGINKSGIVQKVWGEALQTAKNAEADGVR